ncbi:MAG: hypothetical protein QXQ82_00705 [Candidatus Pacearchaeota archaeon]
MRKKILFNGIAIDRKITIEAKRSKKFAKTMASREKAINFTSK